MALEVKKETLHTTESGGGGHMVSQTTSELASQPCAVVGGHTMTVLLKAAKLALPLVCIFWKLSGTVPLAAGPSVVYGITRSPQQVSAMW